MLVFLNGKLLPQEQARISIFDRSFLYGDGLFETMRVVNGRPFRWEQHWERLQSGARFLRFPLPFSSATLLGFACELSTANQMPDSLLRLTLSRGVGLRGYSPSSAEQPVVVMSLHPAPETASEQPLAWRLVTSSFRLPAGQPLAQFKTCNKLAQIMARAEADAAGADEALMMNTDGCVVEGASSNLFWLAESALCTPPLVSGILPGVTRAVVLELGARLGLALKQINVTSEGLRRTEGVFVSLSTVGIAEVVSLDGQTLARSPWVVQLAQAYAQMLRNEQAPGAWQR